MYLSLDGANINWWAVVFGCLYDHGYLLAAMEKQLENLLFQVPGDAVGFRVKKGDPGSHPAFPSAHHLRGGWLETVEGHWGVPPLTPDQPAKSPGVNVSVMFEIKVVCVKNGNPQSKGHLEIPLMSERNLFHVKMTQLCICPNARWL